MKPQGQSRRAAFAAAVLAVAAMVIASGCEEDSVTVQPPSGMLTYDHQGSWNCATSTSCQDVYDIQFSDGSVISIAVTQVTGSSVVRLALFAPGVGLDGQNLLTDANADLMCAGQDSSASVTGVALPSAGTYRLAVGRDWGTSAGAEGTYSLNVTSTVAFTPDMQTADDEASEAADALCQGVPVQSFAVESDWDCATSESCQDVYEVEVTAPTTLEIAVSDLNGNSVPLLALYAPGTALGGTNLLTGNTLDRKCVGQDVSDMVSVAVPAAGVYQLAVGRDWGSSAGATGAYRLDVSAGEDLVLHGQTVDDVDSQASGTGCPITTFQEAGAWSCGTGETCQDVCDFEMLAGSTVTIAVENVTGNSVTRLALFAPGEGLDGDNLLTGTNLDRECVGQDESDQVSVTLPADGTYRLAVGRDWGSSAGSAGTYQMTLTSDGPFFFASQTVNDGVSGAAGSACVGETRQSLVVDASWQCMIGESCQDVFEVDVSSSTTLTIATSFVTGSSVPLLALYAPGEPLGGTNLITGRAYDRECVDQDGSDTVNVPVGAGVHRLAVGRDWGSSAGSAGTYRVTVSAGQDLVLQGQSVDDIDSQALGTTCATTSYQENGGWACTVGQSCQDVYDLDMDAGTMVTIAVTNVTGNSVVRLALFAPGTALSGTNLLNGTNQDRECAGQDANDQVAISVGSTGTYRLAVGRDWGSSAGTSGTYSLSVTTSAPIYPLGRSVSDTDSEAAGSTCP